jgi:hypothetical protein
MMDPVGTNHLPEKLPVAWIHGSPTAQASVAAGKVGLTYLLNAQILAVNLSILLLSNDEHHVASNQQRIL